MESKIEMDEAIVLIMARQIAACQAYLHDEGHDLDLRDPLVRMVYTPGDAGRGLLRVEPTTPEMASVFLEISVTVSRDAAVQLRPAVAALLADLRDDDDDGGDDDGGDDDGGDGAASHAATVEN